MRSCEQFRKKVVSYGESLTRNTRFAESSSVHLRHWYKPHLNGNLMAAYQAIAFSAQRLEDLSQRGYLEPTEVISSFFAGTNRDAVGVAAA